MKKSILITYVIVFLACLSILSPAFAAGSDDKSSPQESGTLIAEKDILFNSLQGLVGQTANIITGGKPPDNPDHIIGLLSQQFNIGIMSFAMLFMIVKGVRWISSMSEQKSETKIFDFQSAPIPIFLSMIILLPLSSGYSPIQNLVILAAGQSISLANKEVNAAADFLDRTGSYNVTPAIVNAEQVGLDLFYNSICLNSLNQVNGKELVGAYIDSDIDLGNDVDYIVASYHGLYNRHEVYSMMLQDQAEGYVNGRTVSFPDFVCGSHKIQFGGIDDKYEMTDAVIDFRQNIKNAYKDLANDMNDIAKEFVVSIFIPKEITENGPIYEENIPPQVESDLRDKIEVYRSIYRHELEILVQKFKPENQTETSGLSNRQATQKLREYGAGYLGVYFWEFSKRNSVTTAMTSIKQQSRRPDSVLWNEHLSPEQQNKISVEFAYLVKNIKSNFGSTDNDSGPLSRSDVMAKIQPETEKIINEAGFGWSSIGGVIKTYQFFFESLYEQPDPIRSLVDFGHNIILASEAILLTAYNVELVSYGLKSLASAADAAAEQAGPFGAPIRATSVAAKFALDLVMKGAEKVSELVMLLLVFGIILAFWLPSIPMIHWISALLGFFIVFMHAMILTPLLGLAHLISGDKGFLNSHTHHGYMAIIQLFIYLPVMVFSFFVSYLLLSIGAKLIQIIFVPFITTMSNDSVAGIVTFIVLCALFIIINIQIFNRCFALITTIPEKTGKFLGGGDEMLGDHDSGSSKNSFVAVAGGITQVAKPTPGSPGKSPKSINQQVM